MILSDSLDGLLNGRYLLEQEQYQLIPAQPYPIQRTLVIGLGQTGLRLLSQERPQRSIDLENYGFVEGLDEKVPHSKLIEDDKNNVGRHLNLLREVYELDKQQGAVHKFGSSLHFAALDYTEVRNDNNQLVERNLRWYRELKVGDDNFHKEIPVEKQPTENVRTAIYRTVTSDFIKYKDTTDGSTKEIRFSDEILGVLNDLRRTSLSPEDEISYMNIYLVAHLATNRGRDAALLWAVAALLRHNVLPYGRYGLVAVLVTGLEQNEVLGLTFEELRALQESEQTHLRKLTNLQPYIAESLAKLRTESLKTEGFCEFCQSFYPLGTVICESCHSPITQPATLFDRCYLLTGHKSGGITAEDTEFDEALHNALEVFLYSIHDRHVEEQCLDSIGPTNPDYNLSTFGTAAKEIPIHKIRFRQQRELSNSLIRDLFLNEEHTAQALAKADAQNYINKYLKKELIWQALAKSSGEPGVALQLNERENLKNIGEADYYARLVELDRPPKLKGLRNSDHWQIEIDQYRKILENKLGPLTNNLNLEDFNKSEVVQKIAAQHTTLTEKIVRDVREQARTYITASKGSAGLIMLGTYFENILEETRKGYNAGLVTDPLSQDFLEDDYRKKWERSRDCAPNPGAVTLRVGLIGLLLGLFLQQFRSSEAYLLFLPVVSVMFFLLAVGTSCWFYWLARQQALARDEYLNYMTGFFSYRYLDVIERNAKALYATITRELGERNSAIVQGTLKKLRQMIEQDEKVKSETVAIRTISLREELNDTQVAELIKTSNEVRHALSETNFLSGISFDKLWERTAMRLSQDEEPPYIEILSKIFLRIDQLAIQETNRSLQNGLANHIFSSNPSTLIQQLRAISRPFLDYKTTDDVDRVPIRLEYLMVRSPEDSTLARYTQHDYPNTILLNSPDPYTIIFFVELHGLSFQAVNEVRLLRKALWQKTEQQLKPLLLFAEVEPPPPTPTDEADSTVQSDSFQSELPLNDLEFDKRQNPASATPPDNVSYSAPSSLKFGVEQGTSSKHSSSVNDRVSKPEEKVGIQTGESTSKAEADDEEISWNDGEELNDQEILKDLE